MSLLNRVQVMSALLLLTTIAATELSPVAIAQSGRSTPIQVAQRRRLSFRLGVRPSSFRIGGFSRSSSCGDQQTVTALVPPPQAQELADQALETKAADNNNRSERSQKLTLVDKTTRDRPTFFLYSSYTSARSVQFTLQDKQGNKELYNIRFQLNGAPGIVAIELPTSGPQLQVGQKYVWYAQVTCSAGTQAKADPVGGLVERVPPLANPQVTTLAEQGIWQDVVATLASQRVQKNSDRTAAEDWATVMQDAGLPQFAQTNIVQVVRQ